MKIVNIIVGLTAVITIVGAIHLIGAYVGNRTNNMLWGFIAALVAFCVLFGLAERFL